MNTISHAQELTEADIDERSKVTPVIILIKDFSSESKKIKNLLQKFNLFLKTIQKEICKPNNALPNSFQKLQEYDEIYAIITSNSKIKKLNKKFRNKNETTDVLTFSLEPNFPQDKYLAEIYISLDMAINQAETHANTLDEELALLYTHGLVHACGIDHEKSIAQEKLTKKLEKKILDLAGYKKTKTLTEHSMESTESEPNESIQKQPPLKSFLARLFGKEEETLREQLQRFFEDQELKINNDQMQMIEGVLSLVNKRAENVKVPTPKMIALPMSISRADLESSLRKSGHTRFPVYIEKETVRDYVGILHVKDLLPILMKGGRKIVLKDVTRKVLFVPENQTLLSLLRAMRQKKFHMALTVNEHGDVSGLVTLEDILEEIVGDILDEHDNLSRDIREIGLRQFRIDALLSLYDINQRLALNLPEERFNTLAGFLLHQLKGDVAEDKEIKYGSVTFKIEKINAQQIKTVIAEIDQPTTINANNHSVSS